METIDLTQTLPAGTSSMLSAVGILMLSAIIVLVVVIMKRWKARVMPGILGVIAYAVFVIYFCQSGNIGAGTDTEYRQYFLLTTRQRIILYMRCLRQPDLQQQELLPAIC
mgnify:FL=1